MSMPRQTSAWHSAKQNRFVTSQRAAQRAKYSSAALFQFGFGESACGLMPSPVA